MKATSFVTLVVVLAWTIAANGQEPRRFFGTLTIGIHSAHATPFDGGVGGFSTPGVPIFADVVILVEEGQSLTWEWIGIRRPRSLETRCRYHH